MLSDNINKDFGSDVAYETEQQRRDGKVVVRQKGTLQILDEWLRKTFRTSDWELWDAAIKAFRELRQLRQKPAHALDGRQDTNAIGNRLGGSVAARRMSAVPTRTLRC